MLVLDTDVLSLLQRGAGPESVRLLARLNTATDNEITATIVSFEEQMRGWLAIIARTRSLERQSGLYRRLRELVDDWRPRRILDFDAPAVSEFRRLSALRLRIGTMDLKIAATVLAHGATLISRNLADFRKVPGLTVEDWTA